MRRWWLCGAMIWVLACSPDAELGEQAAPEASDDALSGGLSSAADEAAEATYVALVAKVQEGLAEEVRRRIALGEERRRLEQRLQQGMAIAEARKSLPANQRPAQDLFYPETLSSLYQERGFSLLMVQADGRPSAHGAAVLRHLGAAAEHALEPEDYRYGRLLELTASLEASRQRVYSAVGMELYESEATALADFFAVTEVDVAGEETLPQAVALLLSTPEESPVPRLACAFVLFQEALAALQAQVVDLEVLLADSYLRYGRDLRHANLNRLSPEERERYGDEIHPKYHGDIVLGRMRADFAAFAATQDAEIETHLQALTPQHRHYVRLQEAYRHYQGIVAAGGWSEVAPDRLLRGGTAPKVVALKKRLAVEGYFNGAVTDVYDDALVQAISAYQETHQMEITGDPSPVFWRSLNISAATRTEEIAVNLRRWHRARYVPRDYYIFINIPDFHAEVWRQGERQMRFKIVVGNTQRTCHPRTGQWTYPNATPLLHARMTYLVFNPYWNVPPRIEQEEYQPLMAKNPNWLEENGFELFRPRSGGVVLRQLPGEKNALGQVKFIFPNKHNTYLHDTPKKALFSYPVRAFSHGCMRVEEPMAFARHLLEQEGKWDEGVIQTYFEHRGENAVDLDRPIDVFIEYFTTQVDDQGRVHFLADIYRYVRDEISPPLPSAVNCQPGQDRGGGAALPAGADFGP